MRSSWMMSGSTIVVVGLNGALQKRFVLPQSTTLIPGNVHRAQSIQVGVGGKGQDVAVALSCFPSFQSEMRLAQFLGSGPEGDAVYKMLQQRLGAGAMQMTVRPKSHLRTCTTIVASDVSTELVEPSGHIEPEEVDELMEKIGTEPMGGLCIMGSMPPGCPETAYAAIYQNIHSEETLCLIDSVVGLETLLQTIALSERRGPTILKVNASELCRMAKVEKRSSEAGGIGPAELVDGVASFLHRYNPFAAAALDGIALTDGKHAAHFVAIGREAKEFQIFRVDVPDLESKGTLYPIGAGDTVAAGTLSAWQSLEKQANEASETHLGENVQSALLNKVQLIGSLGKEDAVPTKACHMLGAFAFGLACGSASCMQEENSIFELEDALRLFREIKPPISLLSMPFDAV